MFTISYIVSYSVTHLSDLCVRRLAGARIYSIAE